MKNAKVRMQREMFSGEIQVYLIEETPDGRLFIPKQLELEELPRDYFTSPFLRLNPTSAQMMMDELWNCGIRPSEGSGSAGALAATERHLADMKKIVFKSLKINN